RTDLADRGETCAEGRYAGRVVFADTTDADETEAVRRHGTDDRRSNQLHAGTARGSRTHRVEIPPRPDLYAAISQPRRRTDCDVDDGRAGGRDELAGRFIRS